MHTINRSIKQEDPPQKKRRDQNCSDSSGVTLKCRLLLLGNCEVGGQQEVKRDVLR